MGLTVGGLPHEKWSSLSRFFSGRRGGAAESTGALSYQPVRPVPRLSERSALRRQTLGLPGAPPRRRDPADHLAAFTAFCTRLAFRFETRLVPFDRSIPCPATAWVTCGSSNTGRVWTPPRMQGFSWQRLGMWSGAVVCPASKMRLSTPRARMEICRSGPFRLRALEALRPEPGSPDPVS